MHKWHSSTTLMLIYFSSPLFCSALMQERVPSAELHINLGASVTVCPSRVWYYHLPDHEPKTASWTFLLGFAMDLKKYT